MKLLSKVLKGGLVIAMIGLMAGITSCGGNSNASKVTLKVMGYGDNSNAEGQTFKRIVSEFEKANPGIKVDYELLYDEAYHQKAVARLAAGDAPDVAYMGADARWGGSWQEAGQQIDNTPYFPSNIDASQIPDFFGTGVKPYLPLGGSNYCTVVGVNMELLNKIGGKLPTTYDEWKALAKLCKDNGIICLSTHGADAWVWGSCVMSAIIARTTGDAKWIEKAVKKEVKFTDKGFVNALDVLSTLVKDGILDPDSVLVDDGTGKSNFLNGQYLMYIDGQWGFGESNYPELSKNLKLIPIPALPNEVGLAGSIAGAWQVGYGITKQGASNPEVLEAAKKFIALYNSNEEVIQRLSDGGISAPILKDFKLPDGMDPCIAEKATLGSFPSCYVIDSYLQGAANDTLNAGMQDIVRGKIDGKTLAENVQKQFDAQ